MQHARGIANATGVHGHIDDVLFRSRRLTGIGIFQQKGPPTSLKARTAPIALLAFRRQTMSHDIGPVTVWTMQHLGNHGPPTKLVALVLNRGYQINSFETPSPNRPGRTMSRCPMDRSGLRYRPDALGCTSCGVVCRPVRHSSLPTRLTGRLVSRSLNRFGFRVGLGGIDVDGPGRLNLQSPYQKPRSRSTSQMSRRSVFDRGEARLSPWLPLRHGSSRMADTATLRATRGQLYHLHGA